MKNKPYEKPVIEIVAVVPALVMAGSPGLGANGDPINTEDPNWET